jgi:F-type H+-transporting ATPase subunit epsilon
MAEKLKFDLVSPERLLMTAEVDQVTVPGAEGVFGVGPGHVPVMSTLRPGVLDVVENGTEKRFFVRGGFAEVNADGLTILAEQALDLGAVDAADLDQEIKNAEEDATDAKTEAAREEAAERLAKLREVRAAV